MSEYNEHNKRAETDDEIRYQNELMKRRFFDYQRDSAGFAQNSIDTYETALLRWQEFSRNQDFRLFNKERAKQFKVWLSKRKGVGGKPISLSYQYHTLRKLKAFFKWLALQDTYKHSIRLTDIDFLNLGKKERQQACQSGRRRSPTIEQVTTLIESIVPSSDVARRDRALFCFALLTGARIEAIVTLPVRSFDRADMVVDQNPKYGVKTKNSKRITTALFPISYTKAKEYFLGWYDYLVEEKGFGPDDPIFPATQVRQGQENVNFYSTGEVSSDFWSKSQSARKIFEKRFRAAGLPYFNPHSFRHLIVKECMKLALTEEQKKAISQNLGHAHIATTFGNYGYGHIAEERQIELLKDIDFNNDSTRGRGLSDEAIQQIAEILSKQDG